MYFTLWMRRRHRFSPFNIAWDLLSAAVTFLAFLPMGNAIELSVSCERIASAVQDSEQDEATILRSLAKFKIDIANGLVADPGSLIHRALEFDYRKKYAELLALMMSRRPRFSKSQLDEILRSEISTIQNQNAATAKKESSDRATQDEAQQKILPVDPRTLSFISTQELQHLTNENHSSGSTRGASTVLQDGRIFLNYGFKHRIYQPVDGTIEVLPDGHHARLMPDGKTILIFKVEVGPKKKIGLPDKSWSVQYYDLQTQSVVHNLSLDLARYSQHPEGDDFPAMDVSPSGQLMALTTLGNEIAIIDLSSGDLLHTVWQNDIAPFFRYHEDVFFIGDDMIQFIDSNNSCSHHLKSGEQFCTFLQDGERFPHLALTMTADRKTVLMTKSSDVLKLESDSFGDSHLSRQLLKERSITRLLKSLPDDNEHYLAAIDFKTKEFGGDTHIEVGIFDFSHHEVFDFEKKYLKEHKIYNAVVGPRNRVVYVFYSSAENGVLKMDIWRTP